MSARAAMTALKSGEENAANPFATFVFFTPIAAVALVLGRHGNLDRRRDQSLGAGAGSLIKFVDAL
jgi:hypothetical protein